MTWARVSDDPNSEAVREVRWGQVRKLVAPIDLVRTRDAVFLKAATDRRVPDVGCVYHSGQESAVGRRWLHADVVRVADFVLGLDVLETQIDVLRERGFNVMTREVSRGPALADAPFDVILAGAGSAPPCRTLVELVRAASTSEQGLSLGLRSAVGRKGSVSRPGPHPHPATFVASPP